ncbi:WAS/WASL-interacting protein family member 1-like [Penaeus chinensis]|uniref:WAS/WASL-interacting protein family member 1-like n=1 Tax=Penaeus chinensis TaxID=139456 RepID=UPI001FB62DCE|nr:WAS/WASL-interacting protein family member 1-like [Penaeus chinensis]
MNGPALGFRHFLTKRCQGRGGCPAAAPCTTGRDCHQGHSLGSTPTPVAPFTLRVPGAGHSGAAHFALRRSLLYSLFESLLRLDTTSTGSGHRPPHAPSAGHAATPPPRGTATGHRLTDGAAHNTTANTKGTVLESAQREKAHGVILPHPPAATSASTAISITTASARRSPRPRTHSPAPPATHPPTHAHRLPTGRALLPSYPSCPWNPACPLAPETKCAIVPLAAPLAPRNLLALARVLFADYTFPCPPPPPLSLSGASLALLPYGMPLPSYRDGRYSCCCFRTLVPHGAYPALVPDGLPPCPSPALWGPPALAWQGMDSGCALEPSIIP